MAGHSRSYARRWAAERAGELGEWGRLDEQPVGALTVTAPSDIQRPSQGPPSRSSTAAGGRAIGKVLEQPSHNADKLRYTVQEQG
jgi:hypothetical protein